MRTIIPAMLCCTVLYLGVACSSSEGETAVEDVATEVFEDAVNGQETVDEDVVIPKVACLRNNVLLSERHECSRDEDCPCGAHCKLGLCRFECLANDDCSGWCDAFGRCRDLNDSSVVGRVAPPKQGGIEVTPGQLEVFEVGQEVVTRIRVVHGGLEEVRVSASEGLEVECQGDFQQECIFGALEVGALRRLKVRLATDPGEGPWSLNIYAGKDSKRVTVQRKIAVESGLPSSGIYRGQIWIGRIEASLISDEGWAPLELSQSLTGVRISVEIRVYPDGTLTFLDDFGLFAGVAEGEAPWGFQLHPDGHFDRIAEGEDISSRVIVGGAGVDPAIPPSTYYDDDPGIGPDWTRMEVAFSGDGNVAAAGNELWGTLTVHLSGMGPRVFSAVGLDERPVLQWRFRGRREGDLSIDEVPPGDGGVAPWYDDEFDSYYWPLPWEAAVAACGDLDWGQGENYRLHAEHYLCYDHVSSPSVPLSDSASAEDLTALGDLLCAGSEVAASNSRARSAFPFFTNSEQLLGGDLDSQGVLAACRHDLSYLLTEPVDPGGAQGAEGLGIVSGCGGSCSVDQIPKCIDGPLVLGAMGKAIEGMDYGSEYGYPTWVSEDPEAIRLAHRLIQQWIEVNSFVARESRQSNLVLFGGQTEHLEEDLSLAIASWDIVMHPRVMNFLLHLPGEISRDPDYRGDPELAEVITEDRTQPVGVCVSILEGLTAQIEAASQLVLRARYEGGEQPADVIPLIHRVMLLYPLAVLMHKSASKGETPPWEAAWESSLRSFTPALRNLLEQILARNEGTNPLGIEDDDLPLYMGSAELSNASEQFSAISEYLIEGWAKDAVAAATGSRQDAIDAWATLLNRKLQVAVALDEQEARVRELRQSYGEKILALCGNPYDLDADQVLDPDQWPDLSGRDCFMNQAVTGCHYDEAELLDALKLDDVNYQLCVIAEVKARLGERATIGNDFYDAQFNDMIDEVNGIYDYGSLDYWKALDPGIAEYAKDVFQLIPGTGTSELLDICSFEGVEFTENEDLAAVVDAQKACQARHKNAVPFSETLEGLKSSPLDKPDCYRGSLGELALAGRAAAKDIEVAKSALQDYTDAYKNAMKVCTLKDDAVAQIEGLTEDVDALADKTETYMGGVGMFADAASAVFNSISLKGDALSFSPGKIFDFAAGTIMDVGSDLVGTGELRGLHDDIVATYEDKLGKAICFNDAEMHLVGADTQGRRVERSVLDLSKALVELRNGQCEVDRLVREGRRRIEEEQKRVRTSLFRDIWEDLWDLEKSEQAGRMEEYRRAMRLAQRTVYLAVRAVEYEWQVCDMARAEVLAATDPQVLSDVLDDLQARIGTGTLEGQKPDELHYVLSLKQQLLQLGDLTEAPAGYHTLTDTQRLQRLLTSPRFAHVRDDGSYLGQLIPFSVMPLGVLGLGDPGTVAMLTGADCAERNWSVNAVLQGQDLVSDGSAYIRVELLQRNTFFSQWCGAPCDGDSAMQASSVRPSRNLFMDPVWGAPGDGVGASVRDESEYTRTRIEAYVNVSRDEFSQGDYEQGSSTELAGRGLYGEYALFFPAEWLDMDGNGGLRLENIDDVLLRFDYVSVAKPW